MSGLSSAVRNDELQLDWRPFRLALPQPLSTARGVIREKRGWLLRLEDADGAVGWGEAAPLDGAVQGLGQSIAALGTRQHRVGLEAVLPDLPAPLAFALGAAWAELGGLPRQRWLAAPASARLLPAGPAALDALETRHHGAAPDAGGPCAGPVFKWKVAVWPDAEERAVLEGLLLRLPPQALLRLDANGCWDRSTAWTWAERLASESQLQWLEQPLPPDDPGGLADLARHFPALPIALDESLQSHPPLRQSWQGWQVRRPSQEGDPRSLLAELERGRPRLMLSTAFETGIGRRWLHHLAAVQAQGPTPVAPGLAPGWCAAGELASTDPERVWRAAELS